MQETNVSGPSSEARPDQYRLSGAWNFRDVGGARTTDGRVVRPGVFFRSSELSHLDADGAAELTSLGVRRVFDLRGDSELARSGADQVPAGVEVVRVPYDNHKGERAPHESGLRQDDDTQRGYMMRAYTSFPSLTGAEIAIRSVVQSLADGDGPVLVHCAAGKDRAGWTVATVLRAAGVADEDILSDFLASNGGIEPLRAHVQAVWKRPDGTTVNPSTALLGVTEEYYRHGLATVDEVHGSFAGYLEALGIDDEQVQKLRTALLTDAD